ncbi:MAG: (4Fe-4S)-binding protein [Chitinophagaceae bacterium]
MDKNNIVKEYSNGEITVVWQASKCIHSGNCVKNLPQVFQPKNSPWVKVDEASSQQIVDAVSKCPSGALSIKKS